MKDKPIPHLDKKLKASSAAFWAFYAALLILVAVVNIERATYTLILLQSLPLLILLPGLVRGYYRSYSWLCFMLLLYFIWAVEGVFRSDADLTRWLYLILICLLYVAAILTGRYRQRVQKGNAFPADTSQEGRTSA